MADTDDSMKRCSRCGVTKAQSEFHRARRQRDGLHAWCRPCASAHSAAYRKANAEAIKVQRAAHYAANAERITARSAAYNAAHPEARAAGAAAWYERNAEEQRTRKAAWRRANPAEQKARDAAYRNRNKAEHAARGAAWRQANPDSVKALKHRRRARSAAVVGSFSAADIRDIRRMQGERCAACRVSLKGRGEVDHIKALAAGGTNDRRNLQLLCKSCNSAKRALDPIDFMRSRGRLL